MRETTCISLKRENGGFRYKMLEIVYFRADLYADITANREK